MRCEPTGDQIDDRTGELTGSWSGGDTSEHIGISSSPYPAPAGVIMHWLTDTVIDGHHLRGRSYFVPAASENYQADGSITSAALASLTGYASDFQTDADGNLVIWHRPRAARAADGSRPAVTARVGSHAFVTASSVPDKVVVLRSRRD